MNDVTQKIRERLRISTDVLDEEITDLMRACEKEMEIAGVYGAVADPLYYQAIVLYCKAHFGYSDQSEQFLESYRSLVDSMALSGDYAKEADDGSI